MNDSQLAALAAELTTSTHPTTLSYDVDNILAAAELNAVNITRIRKSMTGRELMDNTDAAEYAALTADKKSQWLSLCGHDTVNPEVGGVVQNIGTDIFGASTTSTNIGTSRNEVVSQVTILELGVVYPAHVEQARNL